MVWFENTRCVRQNDDLSEDIIFLILFFLFVLRTKSLLYCTSEFAYSLF